MTVHTKNMHSRHLDHLGRQIAHQLDGGTNNLHVDISERLRIAREQALALHRTVSLQTAAVQVNALSRELALTGGWWTRFSTILPLALLIFGLLCISVLEDEQRAHELADVDTELLVDELPPSAYVDPGFAKFLQLKGRE
jgi:hypothetical protein